MKLKIQMSKSKIVYGSIKRKIVSSDLLDERANRDFDHDNGEIVEKALSFEGHWDKKKKFVQVMTADPILKNSHKFYEMTSEEHQVSQMKKLRRAFELMKDEWFVNQSPSTM